MDIGTEGIWTGLLGLVVVALIVLGERLLLQARPLWYMRVGFPLVPPVVPIQDAPTEPGQTRHYGWDVEPALVRWWTLPGVRGAPTGLHGVVGLRRDRAGLGYLEVVWCPPWSPLLVALWFAGLGLWRGEGAVTTPVAVLFSIAVIIAYRELAQGAVRQLHWAWTHKNSHETAE